MIKINKLYSEPELFDPIEFDNGINLILGEKDDSSEKTNGVGKSLSIEFINYCLLTDFTKSRVSKIPLDSFSHEALICLDFVINNITVTSKRSISNHETPILIINGESVGYKRLDDAKNQLNNLLFGSAVNENNPSFRVLLGILMRDERSEFKSIINPYDTKLRIPPNYEPHLYLLGISPKLYKEAQKLQKDIDNTTKARAKLKNDIMSLTGKSFKDANAELNELNGQVEQIKSEMDALENADSYEIIKNEIINIETKLEVERSHANGLKGELSKIRLFKGDNYIDNSEVSDIYERFKEGLGNKIKKDLDEVTEFKKKIDSFKQTLFNTRKQALQNKLIEVNKVIKSLDLQYKNKLRIIDQKGALKSLKITISSYQKKLESQSRLSSFIEKYNEYDKGIKDSKQEKNSKILVFESIIQELKPIKDAFEKSILNIHDYVMGNRHASFNIEVNNTKAIIDFDLRIYDDGSHSNEREKVFFYDLAMLLTPELVTFHPGLLVHDNIFDVDQDTLIKSLNYLEENISELNTRQYILTLNSDKLHKDELDLLKFNLKDYTKASFTKTNRFLRTHYQEL